MNVTYILTLLSIGLVAGMLSGLIGVGGGIIIVPALVYFLSFSQHQAQGTSLGVLSFPVVILAFLSYYNKYKGTPNNIELSVIALIAVGFVIGGFFGGKIAVNVDQALLKKIFGVILLYIGFKMLSIESYIVQLFKK